jgi:hypothetical protein
MLREQPSDIRWLDRLAPRNFVFDDGDPKRAADRAPALREDARVEPRGTTLVTAASIPAVPLPARTITSLFVSKTSFSPSSTSANVAYASGVRWWVTWRASERSADSGTCVGPGVRSLFLGMS